MDRVPFIGDYPVLVPSHSNPDFNAPKQHYHIDYRYMDGEPNCFHTIFDDGRPLEYRYIRKIRETYEVSAPAFGIVDYLSKKFDCAIKGICPHKGLPLINGRCPGHGIAFDDDGKVIKDLYVRINASDDVKPYDSKVEFVVKETGTYDIYAELITKCGRVLGKMKVYNESWALHAGDTIIVSFAKVK